MFSYELLSRRDELIKQNRKRSGCKLMKIRRVSVSFRVIFYYIVWIPFLSDLKRFLRCKKKNPVSKLLAPSLPSLFNSGMCSSDERPKTQQKPDSDEVMNACDRETALKSVFSWLLICKLDDRAIFSWK